MRPEDDALAALDPEALARDAAALVQVPSVTGDERRALELLAELARQAGLDGEVHEYDLAALRRHRDHPGEEAPRTELFGMTATLSGSKPGRLALDGHIDVVWEGTEPWRLGPWSGAIEDGRLHGRGALDMKAPTVAALHALKAIKDSGAPSPTVVLMGVASEEDGGLGTFAALERDDAFDAALLPEPTGLRVVCAQAGALTFKGVVTGKAAHAAERLAGVSAIDRYMDIHAALHQHEITVNSNVTHPLMRELTLPYPLLVGKLNAGEWSSMVPDRLEFEGRLGVPVGADVQNARDALEAVVGMPLEWSGGAFAPGETDADHPWARTVRGALSDELGHEAPIAGVPWGADMRLFTARGIPTVMVGTAGIELAHAVDESVSIDELVTVARTIIRAILRY